MNDTIDEILGEIDPDEDTGLSKRSIARAQRKPGNLCHCAWCRATESVRKGKWPKREFRYITNEKARTALIKAFFIVKESG